MQQVQRLFSSKKSRILSTTVTTMPNPKRKAVTPPIRPIRMRAKLPDMRQFYTRYLRKKKGSTTNRSSQVPQAELESATFCSASKRSIQLRYWGISGLQIYQRPEETSRKLIAG